MGEMADDSIDRLLSGRTKSSRPLIDTHCRTCNSFAVRWLKQEGNWVLCDAEWMHPRSRRPVPHVCHTTADGFEDVTE